MISLTMSREDWRTGSIPELPLLRKQKFNKQKGASMAVEKELIALRADEKNISKRNGRTYWDNTRNLSKKRTRRK